MNRRNLIATGVLVVVALAAALAWWWYRTAGQAPDAAPVTPASPIAVAPPPPAPTVASAPEAAPVPEPKAAAQPLDSRGVAGALRQLLGSDTVRTWLLLEDFPRLFVTTVDNLARPQAPAHVWPVQPTRGRFTASEQDGRRVIDPANAARYAPFVRMVEKLDTAAAVGLYVRLLPVLQKAYEDLGFPGQRFHARLMAVIDHLLAAPEPREPIALSLTEVRGEIPSVRPWVRYEFADPELESASAGHKIMVRVGSDNARRLKAKLTELRAELRRRAKE